MVSYTSDSVWMMEELSSSLMTPITYIGQRLWVTIVLRVLFVSHWHPMASVASFFQGCIFQIWLILANTWHFHANALKGKKGYMHSRWMNWVSFSSKGLKAA
ncbi:hypothetical protein AAHE18_12G219700 [Arachis hypogaea]